MTAPLTGVRVVELASIGPGPHAGMLLADLGADVIKVERPGNRDDRLGSAAVHDLLLRGRRSVVLDLKTPPGVAAAAALADRADVLIEGLRPGVTERLGLGPDVLLARNPRLVYGRVTGWGQHGPLASTVGHDLNFLAVTGALHTLGPADAPPPPPLNYVADFGGGSMLLVVGVLAALLDRERTGLGQVVDAAMVDGVASLSQLVLSLRAAGAWSDRRGANLVDGAAPFYCCYVCADGRYVAVAALEPQFFAELLSGLELPAAELGDRLDRATWPRLRALFTERFLTRSRDEWAERFAHTDACVTPVLDFGEAAEEAHLTARRTYVDRGDGIEAAPAPRFSRSVAALPPPAPAVGSSTAEEILRDWSRP